MKLILAAVLALFAVAPARAITCDQLSTGVGVCLPRLGTDFSNWSQATINAFTKLNSSTAVNGSTASLSNLGTIYVNRIGGMASGTANIRLSSSVYQDSGFYWLTRSSAEFAGATNLFDYGLRSSTAVFSVAIDTYAIIASSGIKVGAGGVTAPWFAGTLNPADVRSGTLGAAVIASSVAATGVGKNTCGDATTSCRLDIDADGRTLRVSSVAITSSGLTSSYVVAGSSIITSAGSTSNTTIGVCLSGSTRTFTTNGGNVDMYAFTSWTLDLAANDYVACGFLVDGADADPVTSNLITGSIGTVATNAQYGVCNLFASVKIAAGSHSYCLTIRLSAHTATVSRVIFGIKESH